MLAPTPSPMLVIWLWIAWVSYANVSDLDSKKKLHLDLLGPCWEPWEFSP